MSKDESVRGPDKLGSITPLVSRIREEAEDAEVQGGMTDRPETAVEAKAETNGDAPAEEEVPKDDEPMEEGEAPKEPPKTKKRKDKIAEMGIVGQEAIIMRRSERKKRQEEYKKNLEKNCGLSPISSGQSR